MSGPDGLALLSIAVGPKTLADARRLDHGLAQLTSEDPTLRMKTDQQTGEVVIAGISETHLEIVLDRLKREFEVEASVGRPKIAYEQRLTVPADGEMKYARQMGGRGHYAHVKLRLYPAEPGSGCIFDVRDTGGAIPQQFIGSVEEGVKDTLAHGVVARYPIDDVRVELYDGSYHDVDSTEAAFRIAGSLAAWIAVQEARPILLEPVMLVNVVVPTESLRDVIKSISGRRGEVQSCQDCVETQAVRAHVPLAELFGYAADLRARTLGRGTFTVQFDRYQPLRVDRDDDGDRDAFVGAPLRPGPKRRESGIAVPEPDDDLTPT